MKCVLAMLVLLTAVFAFAQERGSKLYISPAVSNTTITDGTKTVTTTAPAFNLVLQAEIFKAQLPVKLVSDSAQADYVVEWAAIPEEGNSHGNGSVLFHNVSKELYTVSASLLDKDKQVIWAGSADKMNLHDCAKDVTEQLKRAMKHKK
jgi:hypothetical protein